MNIDQKKKQNLVKLNKASPGHNGISNGVLGELGNVGPKRLVYSVGAEMYDPYCPTMIRENTVVWMKLDCGDQILNSKVMDESMTPQEQKMHYVGEYRKTSIEIRAYIGSFIDITSSTLAGRFHGLCRTAEGSQEKRWPRNTSYKPITRNHIT